MFTAYIDDSGTAPEHKIAIASALIIPAKQIIALENEWEKLKRREHFSCFHMSPFAARARKSKEDDFRYWDDVKRARVYERVRQITRKYGAWAMSIGVKKSDYDSIIPESLRNLTGRYHYSWAVRHLLDHLCSWRIKLTNIALPLEYVFSWMEPKDEKKKEIEAVISQSAAAAKQAGFEGEFDNYGFHKPPLMPGLQCVDFIAWTSYRFALHAYFNEELSEEARIGWKDIGTYQNGEWFTGITIRDSQLSKFVEAEQRTGHAKNWFAIWKEENAKQTIPKVRYRNP